MGSLNELVGAWFVVEFDAVVSTFVTVSISEGLTLCDVVTALSWWPFLADFALVRSRREEAITA